MQSQRVVVENAFANIKLWECLQDNNVESVKFVEKQLDCVFALHNFQKLRIHVPNYDIEIRKHIIIDSHVLISKKLPNLGIPDPYIQRNNVDVSHIFKFERMLKSAVLAFECALGLAPENTRNHKNSCIFTQTVSARGKNLFLGGYVLQIRLMEQANDVWAVRYIVGASYSYDLHVGYFETRKDLAVIRNICDCYSG